MKRPSKQKLTLAASFLVLPVLALPANVWAQRTAPAKTLTVADPLKFASVYEKWAEQFTIVGLYGTHPIYQNSRGEYFWLDPLTGDMKYLSTDTVNKLQTWRADKYGGLVTLVGIDAQGNVVQKNTSGQLFYLNVTTGDMVFVVR